MKARGCAYQKEACDEQQKRVRAQNDLEHRSNLYLSPVKSEIEQEGAFDPEGSLLDYMTWTIASYAIENRFAPPFRLLFTDANNNSFGESILRTEGENLIVEGKFEPSDPLEFPVHCELTDGMGRTHKIVVSPEEVTERVDPELDSVFNKLESYGLVSKIAPPNNFNIMADYQNRFVLLPKRARFVALIKSRNAS